VTIFWVLCPLLLGFMAIFLGLMSHVNILIRFLLLMIVCHLDGDWREKGRKREREREKRGT
jgi:hypothetical protein